MRRMLATALIVILSGLLLSGRAAGQEAQDEVAGTAPIRDLDTLVVTGVQPGPGLWRVSKDGRVLWVLGTVSPLPRKLQWQSREVESVLAQAQEVIWAPSVVVTADIGFFRGVLLATRALGARKNPDKAVLQEVVPAAMYARWQALKRRYIGSSRRIEQLRPYFAAAELYEKAIATAGLKQGGVVGPVVERAIKAHELKQTTPRYRLVLEDPKDALNELRASRLDDLDCFGKTLQRLETDLDAMTLRANAWAVGDIEALRGLPYVDHDQACLRAAMQSDVVRRRATVDVEAEMRRSWLAAAEKALADNAVTFAVLPMQRLLPADGYLAALAAKGFLIEAP